MSDERFKDCLAFNYEFRDYSSPGVKPANGDLYNKSTRVDQAVGDRLAVQLTLKF